ncbi:hypothetical protein PU560_09700 [Georgenia sp. 10Sc9-8]|uniref:Integral membrane protein n=1 Tax=Georgenia halotolerans TaxID=3028317 RepID=A0ABT5TXE3_9MICO|nr:hypothetical protein [Georgenia halotolerans]
MRARGNRWGPAAVLVAVALGPVALALTTGLAAVHRCVPVSAGWTDLSLRLALVRPDAGCPEGTLALGGRPEQVLTVAVGVTTPALLLHVLPLLGAAGFAGVVRAVAANLARRLLPALPGTGARLPAAYRPVVQRSPLRNRGMHLRQVKLCRGPPLPA